MTVAVLIERPDGTSDGIPVATEAAFEALWKPGIEALGLRWLPHFQTGLPLDPDDWPEISDELEKLRQWAAASLAEEEAAYVIRRIERLLLELPALISAGAAIWIG